MSRSDVARITLVTHPATTATEAAAFPYDEALPPVSANAAKSAADALARYGSARWSCGPTLRCRQTAAALGVAEVTIDDGLDECDYGSWRGRSLDEVAAADPAGVDAWLTDPDAAPHGGESVRDLLYRVRTWLDGAGGLRVAAVTHASVVKAALVVALDAPPSAFWRLDVAPLTRTDLSGRPGAWTVRRTAERLLPRAPRPPD